METLFHCIDDHWKLQWRRYFPFPRSFRLLKLRDWRLLSARIFDEQENWMLWFNYLNPWRTVYTWQKFLPILTKRSLIWCGLIPLTNSGQKAGVKLANVDIHWAKALSWGLSTLANLIPSRDPNMSKKASFCPKRHLFLSILSPVLGTVYTWAQIWQKGDFFDKRSHIWQIRSLNGYQIWARICQISDLFVKFGAKTGVKFANVDVYNSKFDTKVVPFLSEWMPFLSNMSLFCQISALVYMLKIDWV